MLLKNKLNINSKDRTRKTPLHFAILTGKSSFSKILIRSGSDINSITEEGDTPLHYALEYHRIPTVKLLILKQAN